MTVNDAAALVFKQFCVEFRNGSQRDYLKFENYHQESQEEVSRKILENLSTFASPMIEPVEIVFYRINNVGFIDGDERILVKPDHTIQNVKRLVQSALQLTFRY